MNQWHRQRLTSSYHPKNRLLQTLALLLGLPIPTSSSTRHNVASSAWGAFYGRNAFPRRNSRWPCTTWCSDTSGFLGLSNVAARRNVFSLPQASRRSVAPIYCIKNLHSQSTEIRVYIYNYAIDCNEINSTLGGTSQLGKSSKRPKLRQPPSLLLLDHQTRFEAIAELQKRTLFLQEQEDNSLISHLGVVLTRNAMLQLRQVVLTFDKGNETSRIIPYKELLLTTSLPESQLQYFDIYIKQPKWSMSWRIHKRAKVVLRWIIDPPNSAPMQKAMYWVDNRDALPTLDGTLLLIRWALRREIWLWNVIIPGLTSQDCGMDDVLETL